MTERRGTPRDMRPANWKRRVKKWRAWIVELREEAGLDIREPDNFETPPHRRIANTSPEQ